MVSPELTDPKGTDGNSLTPRAPMAKTDGV